MTDIKFSIITICRNAENEIQRTVESVLSQSYDNIEYLVMDGDSSDATCEIVKKFSDRIAFFVSEKDTGIFNAMNKGLCLASGDIILFINAGDILFNADVINHAQLVINSKSLKDIDVFHGKSLMYYEDSGDGYLWSSGPLNRFKAFRGSIPHPSTFYSKRAFEKNGLFDETYRIAGDYEWVVRGITKNHLKFKYMDMITAVFYQGGISNHPEHNMLNKRELQKLIADHFSFSTRIGFSILNRFRKILGL